MVRIASTLARSGNRTCLTFNDIVSYQPVEKPKDKLYGKRATQDYHRRNLQYRL